MTAIDDGIDQLRRHRGISRVGEPVAVKSGWLVEIDIPVELPNRAQARGVSQTGVKIVETCTLFFSERWPMRAPRPYLRSDFPRDLPHINPHPAGGLLPPCVYEGSLDELLHRLGLDAVIDQIIDWLGKAASGTLIDSTQGWEPTRRDSCPSTVEFSAERVIDATPADGTVLLTSAAYMTVGEGVYCRLMPGLTHQTGVAFTQTPQGRIEAGACAAFIVRAAAVSGEFPVIRSYQPDTVVDQASLLELATALGIDGAALQAAMSDYYRAAVLGAQDYRGWKAGLMALVILVVKRPAPLIGADGRDEEVLPYVVRWVIDPNSAFSRTDTAHAAFHSHMVSPELLARTSGLLPAVTREKLVLLGCGSLGSKIGMHLARAGIGQQTFVDNEVVSPHNLARHALLGDESALLPAKADQMKAALHRLSHVGAKAFDLDAVDLLGHDERFSEVVPNDVALIVDSTASLQVLAASAASQALTASRARLARTALFGQGRCAVVMLEGEGRSVRVDDINAFLFECCRRSPELRQAMAGSSTSPSRLFVGDNCRSLTTPMADALISRSAAMVAMQLQKWIGSERPQGGQLCIGVGDADGIGSSWNALEVGDTTALHVDDDGGWHIRVLANVAEEIDTDARRWGRIETGGALIGRVSYESRTITLAGLVAAPSDSVRGEATFILGTEGLVQSLKDAHSESLGHLMFIGTWHSHPMGGSHSGIDKETLKKISADARGLPAVSLIWTPKGLVCAVDRW